ncbi:MAG: flagellar protein FlaG [Lachnospira sp.]
MGIESINRVAAHNIQSSVAARPVSESSEVSDAAAQELSSASMQQAVSVQKASDTAENSGTGSDGRKQNSNATMKDVNEINKLINRNTVAEFGYNEPTNRITIKIKDKETDEVIKEIPSEKALEMLAKVWELAGILVDEKR